MVKHGETEKPCHRARGSIKTVNYLGNACMQRRVMVAYELKTT